MCWVTFGHIYMWECHVLENTMYVPTHLGTRKMCCQDQTNNFFFFIRYLEKVKMEVKKRWGGEGGSMTEKKVKGPVEGVNNQFPVEGICLLLIYCDFVGPFFLFSSPPPLPSSFSTIGAKFALFTFFIYLLSYFGFLFPSSITPPGYHSHNLSRISTRKSYLWHVHTTNVCFFFV